MKTCSWDDKYIVLNIYSKICRILLSGVLSGIVLAIALAVLIYPFARMGDELMGFYAEAMGATALAFAICGLLSSLVVARRVIRSWERHGIYRYQENWTYWLFFVASAVSGYAILIFWREQGFGVDTYLWAFPAISAIFLADFLRLLWQSWHCRFLSLLFGRSYECLVTEKCFKEYLRLKVAEARRYGEGFGVMAMVVDHLDDLKERYGSKNAQKVVCDVMEFLEHNTRETDRLGAIGEGKVMIGFTHTDREGLEIAAKRMCHLIKERSFVLREKPLNLTISLGVAIFGENLKEPDDLIAGAIMAVNKAMEHKDGDCIFYNIDGHLEEDSNYH